MWWGIWLISLGSGGFYTIIAPIAMNINLRYLFGVPYPEKMKLSDREWQEYCKETNVFVPWKPKTDVNEVEYDEEEHAGEMKVEVDSRVERDKFLRWEKEFPF